MATTFFKELKAYVDRLDAAEQARREAAEANEQMERHEAWLRSLRVDRATDEAWERNR